jgi:phosphoglycerate dehydrogenase-like enzyme
MPPRIVIAVDGFTNDHLARIRQTLAGWASLELLDPNAPPDRYKEAVDTAAVVIGWPKPEWLASSAAQFVQLPSVGYENYVGQGLEQKAGFRLANAAGMMGVPMSEHVLAMMLAFIRNIPDNVENKLKKQWRRPVHYGELSESVLCLVGLGDIGTEMARRALALGMRVVGVRKHADRTHSLVKTIYPVQALSEAVALADHVVSVLPGGAETARLFDAEVFSHFKHGAYFYNVGRGSSVDEDALIASLKSGRLGGAGLDVFETEPLPESSPLWDFSNVIIAPHVGGRTFRESDRLCDLLVRNLAACKNGEPLHNIVLAG